MELEQNENLNIEQNNNKNDFLNSTLWKTINNGIDIGLRYLLPDLVDTVTYSLLGSSDSQPLGSSFFLVSMAELPLRTCPPLTSAAFEAIIIYLLVKLYKPKIVG